MSEPRTLESHQFNLEGLKVGDVFLGCRKCWFQIPAPVAAHPWCRCGEPLFIYTVTPRDIAQVNPKH